MTEWVECPEADLPPELVPEDGHETMTLGHLLTAIRINPDARYLELGFGDPGGFDGGRQEYPVTRIFWHKPREISHLYERLLSYRASKPVYLALKKNHSPLGAHYVIPVVAAGMQVLRTCAENPVYHKVPSRLSVWAEVCPCLLADS